jgi:RHS repeat-associated protein
MGNATTTTYDADDEVVQTVDPMGRITTATFSVRGWVPTVTSPLDLTTTYAYNNTGQTTSFTQNGQSGGPPELLNYGYNADEELTTAEDALGNFTSYAYDGLGNKISVTDPNHNVTTYAYNSTDELTTVTNGLGNSMVYGYDPSGNQMTVTDSLGHTTTTLYDALDRPTTIISATGGITTITYDAAGRETSLTDPDGNVTKWAYDSDDRVTTLTEPNGHTVTYAYNNDGEVTDMTDADGRTTYSYNADGDETGETWVGSSPSEIITYTYDADNEMTGAKDSFATLTFAYNSGGQVQTAGTTGSGTGQPSVLLSYTYDPAGSETTITDNLTSAGITSFTYDADERVTEVATSYGGTDGPQVVYGYDPASRLTSADRTIGGSGDSVNTTYGYDAANRQTTITDSVYITAGSGGTTTPIATYVYGYDSANRVTTMVDAEGTYTYTYDKANELTNVDENGTQVESYSYDLNGNRTGTGHSTTVMNETATSPGVTYSYDNAGNMISAKNGTTITTYTYDYDNRLTEVTQNGTVIATYVYDALNRRIETDDNGTGTWTVYNGTNPYADFNGSGTLLERYQYGPGVVNSAIVDQLLARTSPGGTIAWYLPDKLGSVRDIVSTTGTELDHIVYDSFGNIVTETNAASGDRFKYAGMQYDAAIDEYYDNARWYSAALGTFITIDPTGFGAGTVNLYGYVSDDPTDATDPTGYSGSSSGGPPYEMIAGVTASIAHFAPPGWIPDGAGSNSLDTASNFFNGWADKLTGGLSKQFRDNFSFGGVPLSHSIDESSTAFQAGSVVGAGHSTILSFFTPCQAGSVSKGLRLINGLQGAGQLGSAGVNASQGNIGAAAWDLIGALGSLIGMSQSCFAAGTPILTPDGSRPIEELRPGDRVLSRHEDNPHGSVEIRAVESVFQQLSPVLVLNAGSQTIRTTREHPFWVVDCGWKPAQFLEPGDVLLSHDGSGVEVLSVSATSELAPMYNFAVEEYHTYFIGSLLWGFSIWVHNSYLGGAYDEILEKGKQSHHLFAKAILPIGPFSVSKCPAIQMDPADHAKTLSYGYSGLSEVYRSLQQQLLLEGDYVTAIKLEVYTVSRMFPGKYDDAISMAIEYFYTILKAVQT